MNSGSNSSRNLIASGDLVISLFLSHKALYPSPTQACTHLYADTAAHKHTTPRTARLHLLLSFSAYSSPVEKDPSAGDSATRTIHQDIHRCL